MRHFYIVFVQKSLVFALFIDLKFYRIFTALALKSLGRDTVPVQVRPRAPKKAVSFDTAFFGCFSYIWTDLRVEPIHESGLLCLSINIYHLSQRQRRQLIIVERGAPPKAQVRPRAPKKGAPLRCVFLWSFCPNLGNRSVQKTPCVFFGVYAKPQPRAPQSPDSRCESGLCIVK